MLEYFKNMKNENEWIFIVLPGFLSMIIIEFIASTNPLIDFRFIVLSFIMTYFNLGIVRIIYNSISYIFIQPKLRSRAYNATVFTFIISIISGYLIGLAIEGDLFYKFVQKLPVKTKLNKVSYRRPLMVHLSEYNNPQYNAPKCKEDPNIPCKRQDWLKIKLDSGIIYEGWPLDYDISGESTELYLSPVCVYENGTPNSNIQGVIIFEKKIESILFLKREESECFEAYQKTSSNNISN